MSEMVYGKNSFFEAAKAGRIVEAYVLSDKEIKNFNFKYQITDRKVLDRMTNNGNHQGYVAKVKEYQLYSLESMLTKENGLIIALDGLEDVHNLGAIIRSAECVGADGIIYKKHNSVKVNETVAKIACGGLEYVKVGEVTNLVNALKQLKKNGYWIVGTDGNATSRYDWLDYNMNIVLVIGSEGKGISRLVKEECDFLVSMPMKGHVTSLNASVAAGVMLYQILSSREKLKS